MKQTLFLPAILVGTLLFGSDPAVSILPDGHLKLGKNIRMQWRHNPAWKPILLKNGKVLTENGTQTLSGECSFPNGRGAKVQYALKENGTDSWNYTAVMRGVGDTKHISVEIKIPADRPADIEVGDKLYRLSGKGEKEGVLNWTPVKRNNLFRIASGDESYTIRGNFSVSIADLRFRTKENYYAIHLHVPESMKEKRFDMNVSIRREIPAMRTVSIAAAANMGFTDPVADDGKGGWTDQGPENDLSCLTDFGKKNFAGIPFEILNPAKNNGKSCIVLSNHRKYPPVGRLIFEKPIVDRYLYLLNAAAWVPNTGEKLGVMELTFADGTKSQIPVLAGKDTGNWWQPVFSFENGIIGWTGDNQKSKVGLFVSTFRIPEKPLKEIRFLHGKGVWMIAGVSVGNVRPQQTTERRMTISQGKNWKQINLPLQFKAGSVMDFSSMNRFYPAKDGALKIDADGHFVLAKDPSKRIRFYATNICQDMTVPTHRETDILVDRLARDGFNSARFHQFENRIYDWTKPSTLDFHPDKLDRFHYLWAKLREKGMYLTTDIHSTRIVRPGDNIEECRSSGEGIRKTLTMFSESAMKNWKDFARKIMTMKNPYTGLSMAEDPALFALNMDNEASIYHNWNNFPELMPLIEKVYGEYLKEKKIHTPELQKKRGKEFYEFLADRQRKIQREQARFLKEELGVKAHITNLNNNSTLNLQPFRYELDLVDDHIYHDHPGYPLKNWNVPISNNQQSAIATGNRSVMSAMMTRIPGKPMIITEIQFCYPNRFRSEIAAMAGAYAALQDWDALYRFAASHSNKPILNLRGSGSFDHYYEPIGILTGRIIHFLFVRGDVASAKGPVLTYGWNNPSFYDVFDPKFRDLGFYTRIGSAPSDANIRNARILPEKNWEKQLPSEMRKAYERFEKDGVMTSSTGEISIDKKKMTVSVVTPKSELFTFPGGAAKGKFLSIRNSLDFSTVSAHAFDNRELAKSRDILVYHLTDALNSETVFQNEEARLMLKGGKLPILAYRGRADLELNVDPSVKKWKVEAIGLDGSVLGTIPSVQKDGKLSFKADVFGPAGVTMVYHITAQP